MLMTLALAISGCVSDSAVGDGRLGGTGGASDGAADGSSSGDDAAADAGSGGGGSDGPASNDSGSDLSGEQLYTGFCSPCHGMNAQGTELGYELQHHDPSHFEWVLRHGRPGLEFPDSVMAPFPEDAIAPSDADKILEYLHSLPQPETGEGLYLDYCGNCHGPHGNDGLLDTEIIGRPLNDMREKIREGENLGSPGQRYQFMPRFGPDALSDAEITLIQDYLNG